MANSFVQLCLRVCCAGVLCGISPLQAHAQADPRVPSTAEPSRIDELTDPFEAPLKKLQAPAPDKKAVSQAPAGADKVKFVLKDLTIQGMSAYSPESVKNIYAQYVGTEITLATLFEIMTALQQKYLQDGYTLTQVVIPNQNIDDGHAVLTVVEGYIAEIEVDPTIRSSHVIDDAVAKIRGMRPLNTLKLENILLVLNDLPDLDVSAILVHVENKNNSILAPGGVRLVLQKNVSADSVASISLDNYGSIFAGPWQVTGTGRIFHIGPNYSTLEVRGSVTSPLSEQRYASVEYEIPVFGSSGAKWSTSAIRAWTEPGSSLDVLDVMGGSDTIVTKISWPVIRQRAKTLTLDASFEYKNSKTDLLNEVLYNDRTRSVSAGANIVFSDRFHGLNILDVHLHKGFDILGARKTGSIDLSRRDGRSDFTKVNMTAGRLQQLPNNFEIYALVTGQYSRSPLLSGDEFGFGGSQIGRGYDSSEIAGDRGVSASIELRYRDNLSIRGINLTYQPYMFFEVGQVWNLDNHDTTRMSAASAGAGVRFYVDDHWDVNFGLAYPLTRRVGNPPKYADNTGPRALFSLTRRF